jgi:hypothetical protein
MNDEVYETFTASDIVNYLPDAFKELFKKEPPMVEQSTKVQEEQPDTDSNSMNA